MHDKYDNSARPMGESRPRQGAQQAARAKKRTHKPGRRLARRIILAFALGLFLALAPIPIGVAGWLAPLQMPLAILLSVSLIGKALYDTLFWDRYG
jgi:hypothetical protein